MDYNHSDTSQKINKNFTQIIILRIKLIIKIFLESPMNKKNKDSLQLFQECGIEESEMGTNQYCQTEASSKSD